MHSTCLLTLAALTGLSSAASVPSTKQAFSVEQVASGENLATGNPAKVLLNTYKKFNAVGSAPVEVVMTAQAAGSVAFTASATAYPAAQWDEVSLACLLRKDYQADCRNRNTTAQ